ncbi:LamG-like jellyroll fold domain-containing protein [Aquisphaera insulae]|uniref:LamG-like jellyroll fold domain-containing protein n=1 Tax=Aquisphaera insulae TaxID=2712864 RepID=UPI0013EC39F7|nr:LamG-like jellyroll fold domain-containing protein [Aquisphaera insulae]
MMEQDLMELLAAFRGGEAAPERLDALHERLDRDEAFQDDFVAEIRMLGMLKAVQSPEPRWLELSEEIGWGPRIDSPEFEDEERIMERVRSHAPTWRRLRAPVRMGIAAALAIGLVAYVLIVSRFRPTFDAGPSRPDIDGPPGLAMILKLDATRWASSRSSQLLEGTLVPASRLRLESGRAVLQFHSGVLLTFEGPADIELVSMTRTFCRQGRLRARVPAGAEGFVVGTEGAAVTDLGTEFAMNVMANGRSQVRVFEGAVEAAILDPTGTPRQVLHMDSSRDYELNPTAGRIIEASVRADAFLEAPDLDAPMLPLDPAYTEAIRRSRPTAYWRFEARRDDAIANEVSGGPPLRIREPVRLSRAVKGNGFAILPPRAPGRSISGDGVWTFLSGPGYAVEFWFLTEGADRGLLVGLYPSTPPGGEGPPTHTAPAFLVETTPFFPRPLTRPDAIRILRCHPLAPDLGTNLYSGSRYRPRQWYHVVAQQDGRVAELYVNGERENSCRLELATSDVPCHLTIGGRTADVPAGADGRDDDASSPPEGGSFVGQLDELAIYDRPLTAEEIREHFRLGNVAGVARPPLASP